jgi:sporulation integral membrane protein YtvI
MDPELQKNLKKLVKWTIGVMILVAVYLLFNSVFPIVVKLLAYFPVVFMPFIFAILLALVIEPVVILFEKYARLKRNWAVFFSLVMVIGGFIFLVLLIVSVTIKEMSALYPLAMSRSDQIIGQVMASLSDFRLFYLQLNLPPQLQAALQDILQKGLQFLQYLMNNSINALVQGFASLPGILMFLGIATVATFFIIKDRALIRTFVMDILPSPARSKTREVITELLRVLSGFFKAYTILITITAVLTLVCLKILGVKYAFTMGIIVGLLDILPIFGPGAVMVPWIIWEFIAGNPSMGISLTVVYTLITMVRQFMEPQIVGDSIGLHPLATMFSLYVGLQLGGVGGMILGPVLVVIFIASYRAGLLKRYDWRERS